MQKWRYGLNAKMTISSIQQGNFIKEIGIKE